MPSSFDAPRVRRRTITLTHDKVLKDIACDSEVRIIRGSPPPKARIDYQDPFLGSSNSPVSQSKTTSVPPSEVAPAQSGATVLVINASQEMAQEITVELSRTLPGCSILFAPTLHLALWMLKRRSIDIILSSATLPDGPLSKLHESLELLSPPPELVILSDLTTTRSELGSHPGYRFVELRRVPSRQQQAPHVHQETSSPSRATSEISSLGANLRNDLNNPLQEIVAMAFVATSSQGLSPIAEEALSAIQRAASNMATVVNSLEDKIRSVVDSPFKVSSTRK
jgi:signal transduction histidine kinase